MSALSFPTWRRGLLPVMLVAAAGCAHLMRNTAASDGPQAMTYLWSNPADIGRRNLFNGPGGEAMRPRGQTFTFVEKDTTGFSPGYDVRDASGREWSVKLGEEVQSEIATSRLLWGIGYHQPPTYFVSTWTLAGGDEPGPQPAARFRPDINGYKVADEWSWFENPFVGSRAFGGLIAANLLLNNWDFKTSNNKLYEREGAGRGPQRMYVVRDLGASLGKTSQPALLSAPGFIRSLQGSRNDIDDFEAQGFVTLDEAGTPDFDYKGNYGDLVRNVTVEDVVWMSRLMSRLSDRQMNDAFRAAGYEPAVRTRYVKKIRSKLAEGISLSKS